MLSTTELDWKRYLKMTPTRARQISQADFEQQWGIFQTREGQAILFPGDYLAIDNLGEYPIRWATIRDQYVQQSTDEDGYTLFLPIEPRNAIQLHEAFTTERGLTGQPGDYLLRGQDGRTWPCARSKFEREYQLLAENVIYSVGYLNPNALDLLQTRVKSGAIIVDIRLVAASGSRPDFSGKRLRERFGTAYHRCRNLGNDNYNQPDGPISLHNPEVGIPELLSLLEQHDVCLLCRCQQYKHCHTAAVVAEIQRTYPDIQIIRIGEEWKR